MPNEKNGNSFERKKKTPATVMIGFCLNLRSEMYVQSSEERYLPSSECECKGQSKARSWRNKNVACTFWRTVCTGHIGGRKSLEHENARLKSVSV